MPLHQSSVRLIEQGPRMTLQLIKIEEGFLCGEVLYHRNITKTEEEKAAILQRRLEKRLLKEARKKEQEERKRIKELAKQELNKKSLEGQKKASMKNNLESWENNQAVDDQIDDDAAWFKAEVGKDPDSDLFVNKEKGAKRKSSLPNFIKAKKGKK